MVVFNKILCFVAFFSLLLGCIQQFYRLFSFPLEHSYHDSCCLAVENILVFLSSLLLLIEVFSPQNKLVKYKLWIVFFLSSLIVGAM